MKFAEGNEHLEMIPKREVLAKCATSHRNLEKNGPAQGLSQPAVAPERSPSAPNVEGGSQGETEVQERCAAQTRGDWSTV